MAGARSVKRLGSSGPRVASVAAVTNPASYVRVRSLLPRLWQYTERVLRPLRRRRALARLRRHGVPESIVFVCHGNICRSPDACAASSRRLPQAVRTVVRVGSAGFIGPGRPAPFTAVKVARRRGRDLSAHRSTLVGPEGWIDSNLVIVMEPGQGWAIQTLFVRDARHRNTWRSRSRTDRDTGGRGPGRAR
jgi:protein-tyrosine-phosphatase